MSTHSEIRCECGKRILVPPDMNGKRVKCPKCKAKYFAPKKISSGNTVESEPVDEVAEEDADATFVFSCDCGKSFSAKPSFAGNMIRCSSCSEMLRIPGGDELLSAPSSSQIEDSIEVSREEFFAIGSVDDFEELESLETFSEFDQSVPVARPVTGAQKLGIDPLDSLHGSSSQPAFGELAAPSNEPIMVIAESVEWSPISPSAYNAVFRNAPTWLVIATFVLSLLVTLALPVMIYATLAMTREGLASNSWEPVEMKITHSRILSSEEGADPVLYRPLVQYEYEAGGSSHIGQQISFRDEVTELRTVAERDAAAYPVDSIHEGRYDIDDPKSSVLSPGLGSRQRSAIYVTLACLLAPILLFLQGMVLLHRAQMKTA